MIEGSDDEKQALEIPPDDEAPLASKAGLGPAKSNPALALQLDVPPPTAVIGAPGVTAPAPSGVVVDKLVVGRIIGPIAPSGAVVGKAGREGSVLIAGAPIAPRGVPEGAPWARLPAQLSKRAIVVTTGRIASPCVDEFLSAPKWPTRSAALQGYAFVLAEPTK